MARRKPYRKPPDPPRGQPDPRAFLDAPTLDDDVAAGWMHPDGRIEIKEGAVAARAARVRGEPYRVRLLRSTAPGYPAGAVVEIDPSGRILTPPANH